MRSAAAAFSVSPATAHRWWHRWCEAGEEARRTLSCLFDRSSRPRRSPRQLRRSSPSDLCLPPRDRLGATPGRVCDRVLPLDRLKGVKPAGLSRPPRPLREPANSYEWPCPGDLLHMDTSEYVRFQRPGHRVTGDRSSQDRQHRDGIDYRRTRSSTTTPGLPTPRSTPTNKPPPSPASSNARSPSTRATAPPRRLMTDNAWSYVKSRACANCSTATEIRHLTTKPYATHQRQGRTLPPNDGTRVGLRARLPLPPRPRRRPATLARPLQHTRPHSSLAGQPPISRVHNLRRQDN